MSKFVVSTWHRDTRQQQAQGNAMRRLSALRAAVAQTNAVIAAADFSASGLIKGIFVAPEYSFAARLAGFQGPVSGKTRGRSLHAHAHSLLLRELASLSAMFPRILIIPGTIAWKAPISETELDSRLKYYFSRAAYKPKLSGEALTRALKGTWKRSTIDGRLYHTDDIRQYKKDNGGDMPTMEVSDTDLAFYQKDHPAWFNVMVNIAESDAGGLSEAATSAAARLLADDGNVIRHMMSNTAYAFLNGKVVFSYSKQSNYHEELGDSTVVFAPGARSGVAQIEELTFGLEVCLDHSMGLLRHQLRAGREIDVQIVISDWVEVAQNNIVARDGGFFVHASTNWARAGLWQVDDGKLTKAPVLGWGNVRGGQLLHSLMKIDVYDPFSLAGSFLAKKFASR